MIAKSTRRFKAKSQSLSEVYRWTDNWCQALHLERSVINAFRMAVYEAACNVVEHAYRERDASEGFAITLVSSKKAAIALMEDHGHLFDIGLVPPPDFSKKIEDRQVGGLGVHFIRNMMDRVITRRKDKVNRLIMIKYLSPTA